MGEGDESYREEIKEEGEGGLTLTCSEFKLISLVISLEGIVESRVPNVVSSST